MTLDLNPSSTDHSASSHHIISKGAGIAVILFGTAVLIGWQFELHTLKSFAPDYVSVKANTAAAFILAGIAVLFLQRHISVATVLARCCGVLVMLIGLLSFARHFLGLHIGFEELLFHEPEGTIGTSHPGLMAPNTAVNFCLLGLGITLFSFQRRRSSFLVEFLLVFPFAIGTLGLVGCATELVDLLGPSLYTQMAPPTAGAFIILCVGLLSTVKGRQRSPMTVEQKLFAGLTTASAVITFVSFLSVSAMQSLVQASEWVEHTQQQNHQLRTTLLLALDAEAGVHGFVLSDDERYAKQTETASLELLDLLDQLRRQFDDTTAQQKGLSTLKRLVSERMVFSEQVLHMRRARGLNQAIVQCSAAQGRALSDSIRSIVTELIDA